MIEDSSEKQNQKQEQLKRFNFFDVEKVQEQIDDPRLHPQRLSNLNVTDVAMIGSKYL